MPLFSTIQLSLLKDVATSRSQQLEMDALQPYADYLYDIIVEEVKRNSALIFSDIYKAAQTTDTPDEITVPFWKFDACSPVPKTHDPKRQDSYIGVTEDGAGWYTSWSLPPVSLDILFRKTDICTRLSAFLAPNNIWVHPAHTSLLFCDEDVDVWQNELTITFYPSGLAPDYLERIEAVKAKYLTSYTPRPLEEGEVIASGGTMGRRAPRTPVVAPAPAPAAPPLLPLKRQITLISDSEGDDEPVSPPCFCNSCTDSRFGDDE